MLKQRLLMATSYGGVVPPTVGSLYACGPNARGGTAQNTASGNTLVPTVAVTANVTWLKVSAGRSSQDSAASCVGILEDGTLWSWGANKTSVGSINGNIGQGNNNNNYYVPTQVGSVSTWADVTQGSNGGLAIRTDSTLWSWGYDAAGQLGTGTLTTSWFSPTQVGSDTDWYKVWTAQNHTFVIKTDGSLWTMGDNVFYRTGLNTNTGNTLTPTQIGSDTDWVRAVPTARGGLAIKSDGTLWSWGSDQQGELCQGSATGVYTTPTQAGTDTDWAFVATNGFTAFGLTFLIKTDGTLWTAGNNVEYGTGLGTNVGTTVTVTQVGTDTDWQEICCAQGVSNNMPTVFGLKTDGTIWSWGMNTDGRSGQNTATGNTTVPTQIGTDTDWIRLGESGAGLVGLFIKA